ncbi:MAG: SRPBCC family protein [Bryobacteraceae bacterium]
MMAEQTASGGFDPSRVRKSVRVQVPQAVAWRVFTEQMGTWWPLENYKIGQARAINAVVEPGIGGRWYEVGEDGSTCQWGSVLAWEPQSRLLLSWDITADWQYDPSLKTEIEICFIPEGKNATRVDLEHRRLDRYGARRDQMRRIFEAEGDWGRLLEMFARAAVNRKN